MSNDIIVVQWPVDGRWVTDPRLQAAEPALRGTVWRLPFPLLPGRDWAPKEPQLAWAADIMLALARAGYHAQVIIPWV